MAASRSAHSNGSRSTTVLRGSRPISRRNRPERTTGAASGWVNCTIRSSVPGDDSVGMSPWAITAAMLMPKALSNAFERQNVAAGRREALHRQNHVHGFDDEGRVVHDDHVSSDVHPDTLRCGRSAVRYVQRVAQHR